jgi:RimJ/RimL family protein N-acetyltransferase
MPRRTVLLREVDQGDLPEFFRHQQDPVAWRMAAFPPRDEESFYAHWAKILAEASVRPRTIVVDGLPVGYVARFDQEGRPHVGYWIGREHWGRGIATLALAAFLEEQPERPVYARVVRHNLASMRVLQKCGFAVVGEAKAPADSADDSDEIIFALTAKPAKEHRP